jgi:hypothetical protein
MRPVEAQAHALLVEKRTANHLTKPELADWSSILRAHRFLETSVPSNFGSTAFWATIFCQQTTPTYNWAVNADRFYAKNMFVTRTVLN